MTIKMEKIRQHVTDFEFWDLFNYLGWDNANLHPNLFGKSDTIYVDNEEIMIDAVAQKRQVMVFHINFLPDYSARRKIDQTLTKLYREHIIIYTDAERTEQIWQWVRREPGQSVANRELRYKKGQSAEQLSQALFSIAFSLDEEDSLNIVMVSGRIKAAFDLEPVTKKFYKVFEREHEKFLDFIDGFEDEAGNIDEENRRWYTSVMLNRLMFIYFIQYKGFLDNNTDYLNDKLKQIESEEKNYYHDFLKILFFKGFAVKEDERPANIQQLLRDVPYLNGGLFMPHQIEKVYGNQIQIPNEAFEKIFAFFDNYRWHLNEKALQKDNEINPDVLGYIFEKYINQKQMGAYYTQEDITEYISKNTIIPYLFDAVQKQQPTDFKGDGAIWELLALEPDEYIYDAMSKGIAWTEDYDDNAKYIRLDEPLEVPEEIEAGRKDVSKRDTWNTPTPPEYGLPTEIWRETIARYDRYYEVKNKLKNGEVLCINDLITYNLDIQNFAQKVIYNADPELLAAFWKEITAVTVLDPTCGSGAFLFAAVNILEPLYKACLSQMRTLLAEAERTGETFPKQGSFHKILERVDQHPNENYFVLKTIIVNNLYGVDIMEEAIEIAKLRLFLKMVAQLDDRNRIEPLPDIDFNIRAGNTLVGFATHEQLKQAIMNPTGDAPKLMILPEEQALLDKIEEKAEDIDHLFKRFQQQQTDYAEDEKEIITSEDKDDLRAKLKELEDQLNQLLAGQYGIKVQNKQKFEAWEKSHTPFHWFTEFYGVINQGGFDVVIGNPPYVEYSKIKKVYKLNNYDTEKSGNLYAFTIERCFDILKKTGRLGMIVQLPIVCTDRMTSLQQKCIQQSQQLWFSNYDDRPAKLFDGIEHIRATIVLSSCGFNQDTSVFSTNYTRWYTESRPTLFEQVTFADVTKYIIDGAIPKIGISIGLDIMSRLQQHKSLNRYLSRSYKNEVLFHNAPQYWVRSMDYAPYFWNERDGEKVSTQMKSVYLANPLDAQATVALLNSSIFYWWFIVHSDCRHLNLREINNFPIGIDTMAEEVKSKLKGIVRQLMTNLQSNAIRKEAFYQTTGRVAYDEFSPRLSKLIIDNIDTSVSEHYGFTDEELDFIINYDIKYRMGDELNSDD